MNAINPRMHRALAQPGCHTGYDYAGLSESEIRRHEFYDWLGRECGVKYFIGSRMIDTGATHSFVSVDFSPRHGQAEPHEIELFHLLSRHVASAWRLSRTLPTRCGSEAPADAVVMVAFPSDPDLGLVQNEDLRAIFGRTEREAELAVLIAGGWPLKAAAGHMAIAHNTARVHLANVMTKVGARSQVTLVALLRSLPGSSDDAPL